MTKPNFEEMTQKELIAYMLEHRDENEALRVLMDRAHADTDAEFYPAPQSIDDLKHFPELLEKRRQQRKADS